MTDKILLGALLLGMAALWVGYWALMRIVLRHEKDNQDLKRRVGILGYPEEQRCGYCGSYQSCPARNSGVIYPCSHFTPKEDHHGTEE